MLCSVTSVGSNSATLWSPPGSSVHEIYQARRLDWFAMPSSKRSSRLRDWTQVFCLVTGGFSTAEPLGKPSRQPRDSRVTALQKLGRQRPWKVEGLVRAPEAHCPEIRMRAQLSWCPELLQTHPPSLPVPRVTFPLGIAGTAHHTFKCPQKCFSFFKNHK